MYPIIVFVLSLYGFSNVFGADECAAKDNTYTGGAFDSNLPLIVITTSTPIPSAAEDKIMGTMRVYDGRPGRSTVTGTPVSYDGSVKIGRRGQSSDAIYCKKQYSLKTRWANDTKRGVELLGLPEESDWVVQGPYADKTQQRQALMMALSNSIGMYAPRYVFVELLLIENGAATLDFNQHYAGVYLLMEQITRGSDRVDVKKLTSKSTDLSGGYILKKDKTKDGNVNFLTSGHIVLSMVYPEEDEVTPEQLAWIGSYVSCFEDALYSSSFTDGVLGYPNYINVTSFIDYFLLSELSNNADSYKYSTYMYKEKNSVLNMGPLWDYDLAFGNIADWLDAHASCRPPAMNPVPPCTQFFKYEVSAKAKIPDTSAWFARLLKDPVFKQLMNDRWVQLRASQLSDATLNSMISSTTALINEAAVRNFQKWRDPGLSGEIWPEPNTLDKACCFPTFAEHVEFLRKYVLGRAAWMDGALKAPMYSIDVAPPALSCCSDPIFKSCPKPGGGTCSVSQGDINAGIGQFFDTACLPGIPGTEGCIGLFAQGACRSCLLPNWNPQSGVGSGSWIKCNPCAQQASCTPLSPTPMNPTPGVPTESPSPAPSEAPTTEQPTSVGETRSPSKAPSSLPTEAPANPTSRPSNPPTIPPTPKATGNQQIEEESSTPIGSYVAVIGGVICAILAVAAAIWFLRTSRQRKHDSLLHQGLLQGA